MQDEAHPRSRGENQGPASGVDHESGSSPLTRGKPLVSLTWCEIERLIPAHAGKTRSLPSRCMATLAHPRSRGENLCEVEDADAPAGSSPLTRGKLEPVDHGADGGRLIPAHAGKTSCRFPVRSDNAAHPRSRGENKRRLWIRKYMGGSSPLTRGKPGRRDVCADRYRLIPAHAGKTASGAAWSLSSRAHPRSRGENPPGFSGWGALPGSSPLTRGKRWGGDDVGDQWRLIPAHAGKTARRLRVRPMESAHPRSRGENLHGGGESGGNLGSSPLTRGKPRCA